MAKTSLIFTVGKFHEDANQGLCQHGCQGCLAPSFFQGPYCLAPAVFGRYFNPIQTRGISFAHHITTWHPRLQNLSTGPPNRKVLLVEIIWLYNYFVKYNQYPFVNLLNTYVESKTLRGKGHFQVMVAFSPLSQMCSRCLFNMNVLFLGAYLYYYRIGILLCFCFVKYIVKSGIY